MAHFADLKYMHKMVGLRQNRVDDRIRQVTEQLLGYSIGKTRPLNTFMVAEVIKGLPFEVSVELVLRFYKSSIIVILSHTVFFLLDIVCLGLGGYILSSLGCIICCDYYLRYQ